ncbi:MAG: hypothetical protein HY744_17325 [Deltaproteobacteria bacterium]|nr:hypothetical protein [Deltaproteobacteria bacterium]
MPGSRCSDTGVMAAYVVAPYAQLASASTTVPFSGASQWAWASDDTLVLWGMDGMHVTVYDRLSDVAKTFPSAEWPKFGFTYWVGADVLVGCYNKYSWPEICVWRRATHSIEPLLPPAPGEVVPDAQSDGQTLVWIQAPPGKPPWEQGHIWTSPYATSKKGLVPEKRRPAPVVGSWRMSVANEGYYAVGDEAGLNIYRLSDMHHWAFPIPPQDAGVGEPHALSYVDADELWYWTDASVIRQRLDALGPGDPAPEEP